MTGHTPTLRKTPYSSIVGISIVAQPDPKQNSIVVAMVMGAREQAEYWADTIVRAVNSHDALVEALQAAQAWAWEVSDEKIDGEGTRAEYAADLELISAALKLAGG